MIINSKFLNGGTGLPVCMAPTAPRPGTGVSSVAHVNGTQRRIDGLRHIGRTETPAGIALATAVVAAYPQVDADLPTIKQFRVPLSIRERSS